MEGFLNPPEVLTKLRLRNNMVAADFGCGSGGWVIPLAKKLTDGKVYAVDILEEPLSALRSKIKLEKIYNVFFIKADVEKTSRLFENSCDLILMTNLLFETEEPKKMLEEAKRVLKEDGRILIVDWKEDSPFGPQNKISVEVTKRLAKDTGFILEKEFEASIYHYGLIFTK